MDDEMKVSVICNAYNHEKYIKDTLESLVMQKTSFPYEILVHDDASSDHTPDIIRTFEEKYPDLIRPIYQTENQYSKKNGAVAEIQLGRAKGKYIALCEGDDYWTDADKLQKQYDALECHPDLDICVHAAIAVKANTKKYIRNIAPKDYDTIIPVEDVIAGGGEYVATNSIMYRKSLNDFIPPFRKELSLDYTLQIHGSLRGGMLYLKDVMSAYRQCADNSWTSRQKANADIRKKNILTVIHMLESLDHDTDLRYHDVITGEIIKLEFVFYETENNYKKLKDSRYRAIFSNISFKHRLLLCLKHYAPWLVKLKRYINESKI